ncbi:MAG: helix-turn-helix domain-containing protein [Chitinophagaceae bacterium]|nr:MAG: helix-turn-helix domain-containing protein [Chitinophagaceae bacterium]
MVNQFEDKSTLGRFIMYVHSDALEGTGLREGPPVPFNTFVYNKGAEQQVVIDGVSYKMPGDSILPLVAHQHFQFETPGELVAWQFNREFYCIADHDAEVGCVGFLFYGIDHPMFIKLGLEENETVKCLETMFAAEWQTKDLFQGEMLRTLLKHLIIKVTRMAKQQNPHYRQFPHEKLDIVRHFALLLEGNFKQEHGVKFYADQLNRSPKTLSNLFGLLQHPSPSRLIQNRIVLEAKRYLLYTEKSSKEIANELGFDSAAHFSRFFKAYVGRNVSDFRKN